MKSAIVKGAIGVLGASGLGVGGYYGINALNNDTGIQETIESTPLSEQLKKEKYIPLTNSTNSHIATILSNYRSASSISQDLKFTGFDGNQAGTQKAEEILWEKCKAILDNENADTQDQKRAKKWCVEPTDVNTLLKARGTHLLNADDNSHHKQWGDKIKAYRINEGSKISDLTFANKQEDPTEDEIGQIKRKCKEIGAIKNHDDKFEETLTLFVAWCSNN